MWSDFWWRVPPKLRVW